MSDPFTEITNPLKDAERAWYWSEEWQRLEREALEDLAEGRSVVYADEREFLAALEDA